MRTRAVLLMLVMGLAVIQVAAQEVPTATASPTATSTATLTLTPTPSETATATLTATWTPVVQTVIVQPPPIILTQPAIVITQPPVVLTAPPAVTVLVATPAAPRPTSAPPPTLLTPFYGWQRYQSIYFIPVIGTWKIEDDSTASARQFRASSSARALLRYPFQGDGIRLAYRAHPQGCRLDVIVDDAVLASLDSSAPETSWQLAGPYFLSSGYHVLDLRSQAQAAGVCSLDVDYLEVFVGPPAPIAPAQEAGSSANIEPPQDVAQIVLLAAPPTPLPTPTPIPAAVVRLTLQIAYDANASDTVDLDEGVSGVSIRLVNAVTGELLHSGVTDTRGVAHLQVVVEDELTVTIPILGRTLTIRPTAGQVTDQTWTVLLPPANQPAVIP
jgi:hypothetical protein